MARLQPFRSTDSSNRSGFTETFGSDLALSADGGLLAYGRLARSFDFNAGFDRIEADLVIEAADDAGFGVDCPSPDPTCTYRYRSQGDFAEVGAGEFLFTLTETISDFSGSAALVVQPIESDRFLSPPPLEAPALAADGTTLAFERGDQIVVVDVVAGSEATPWIASTAQKAPLALDLGGGGNARSFDPALSGTGDRVAFVSEAPNLLNAAGSAGRGKKKGKGKGKKGQDVHVEGTHVLVKDLETGSLLLVSADHRGTAGDGPSGQPQLSGDGRFVVFESDAENLVARDGNGARDVFLKDLKSGRVTLLSSDRRKDPGNGPSQDPALALDGRDVAFTSSADDLVPGDLNGMDDVYVKDVRSGRIAPASADPEGNLIGGSAPSISGDGRYVVFQSNAEGFVSGDGSINARAFVKDMITGELVRLDPGNINNIANTTLDVGLTVEISADGSTIAFFEGSRGFSIDPNATPEELDAAVDRIEFIFENDPLFSSRLVVGVIANPFFQEAGADPSLRLDSPIFDLGQLLPGGLGTAGRVTEALLLQDGGPAGLDLPDHAVLF